MLLFKILLVGCCLMTAHGLLKKYERFYNQTMAKLVAKKNALAQNYGLRNMTKGHKNATAPIEGAFVPIRLIKNTATIKTISSIQHRHNNLCLVSSGEVVRKNGYELYPVEIYKNATFPAAKGVKSCHDYDTQKGNNSVAIVVNNYTCPLRSEDAFCPISGGNVFNMLPLLVANNSQHANTATSTFCPLLSKLQQPGQRTRVIVGGGSYSSGVMAAGCCNGPECSPTNEHGSTHGYKACAWPQYLGMCMADRFPNTSHLSVAKAGHSSEMASELFVSMLQEAGVTSLSSNDIVFLDYGVNDAAYSSPGRVNLMAVSFEKLVRRVLAFAASTSGTVPTIVIVDGAIEARSSNENLRHYREVYRSVAVHYSLPYWTVRDAIVKGYAGVDRASHPFIKHVSHEHAARNNRNPPWHVHLHYADLMAAALEVQFTECGEASAKSAAHHAGYKTLPQLPSPLYGV